MAEPTYRFSSVEVLAEVSPLVGASKECLAEVYIISGASVNF